MKKILIRILTILILAGAAIGIVFSLSKGKELPQNPLDYAGNTAANLYNHGKFVEFDGKIYFANAYDNDYIYCMDVDLQNIKKLYEDSAEYLNVDSTGQYLYYSRINYKKKKDEASGQIFSFSDSGIYRLQTNGKNLIRIFENMCGTVLLAGNTICFQFFGEADGDYDMYTMTTEGENLKRMTDYAIIPVSYYKNSLYFSGVGQDHAIYQSPLAYYAPDIIADVNGYQPVATSDGIYFMSQEDNYSLCKLKADGTVSTIISERISTFNMSKDNSLLFYQIDGGKNNRLCCYNQRTGEETVIMEGDFKNLNTTGRYLFFESFDDSNLYYYEFLSGTVKTFRPYVADEKKTKK